MAEVGKTADVTSSENAPNMAGFPSVNKIFSFDEESGESITKKIRLTKSEKKLKKYQEVIAKKKATRKEKKDRKKTRVQEKQASVVLDANHVTKKERLRLMKEKMQESMKSGQRVCVDLSLEGVMSKKQTSRLVQQLGRLYGANRKADKPLSLHFTSLDAQSYLYKECARKNCGFEKYDVHMTAKSHMDVFDVKDIVYLSPDSETTLTEINKDKVYVIGGLIDDSVDKNRTKDRAKLEGLTTAKLPIETYMHKVDKGNFSKVLTVNQVFDILLTFHNTQDWRKALEVGVAKRTGYVLNDIE